MDLSRVVLNDYQIDNTLISNLAGSGNIILMASIMDEGGAITNTTTEIYIVNFY